MQHHTGLYKKIGNLYTPEDIAKWIAERKRLYPTKENVARRQAEQEEKLNRGERLGENKNRFGRNSVSFISGGTRGTGRGRGRGRGRRFHVRSFSHARGNSATTGKSKKPPQLDISYEEDNSMHRKLPAFLGTAAFSETAAAASGGDSGSDQDGEQFSDAEWEAENDVAVDDKPTNSHIPVMSRALSSLMGLYASGSSESEGENGKVTSRSMVSHTKNETVSCKDKTLNTNADIVDSCGPEILDDVKAGGTGNNKHEYCVTSSAKFDDSDSGPEEAPILRESNGVQDSGSTNTCVKSQENENTNLTSRKRRRHHKPNSHKKAKLAPREKTGSVCHERNASNRSSHIRKRKLTLLEKLLSHEIRHERNMILQCVRYTVQNNFFTTNASTEGQKSQNRSTALMQCIRYVIGTNFLSMCQTHTLQCDDTKGTKITGGGECHNCTLVCESVNEVNTNCVHKSERGGANEGHVTDATSL